jgi:hypothetical protein
MEIRLAHHISPIPYIFHAYGGLLAHERRIAQCYNHNINRVHLVITVANQNKNKDQIQYKPNYEWSLKP